MDASLRGGSNDFVWSSRGQGQWPKVTFSFFFLLLLFYVLSNTFFFSPTRLLVRPDQFVVYRGPVLRRRAFAGAYARISDGNEFAPRYTAGHKMSWCPCPPRRSRVPRGIARTSPQTSKSDEKTAPVSDQRPHKYTRAIRIRTIRERLNVVIQVVTLNEQKNTTIQYYSLVNQIIY